ncbi:molybdenum cofactor guanylyltransferase MobA [Salinarimonas ramus]|uniref:Molybdenum cofactor guanylyltransferase n=1 Tax=Salinarimonas ramus TaxID=690164 RepID=A0A917Q5E1_9HYPH|nr:molybdenum cofactor guanylyltransferase MobA [Salinarimonas ramus]GGK24415.1 molybdenum cofactor guanylyltransferase [Salinarimonas ramus]
MSEAYPATLGIILAGGLARRMGGGDKPLRTVGGRSILARVIERLAPQCVGLVLNANGDPARFAETGLPVVADDVPGFAGPLAGVLAGLDWAAANRPDVEWAVTLAADTPFAPRDLVSRLHAARAAAGVSLACAESDGRTHPVNALWPVSLREALRHALVVEDLRKIDRFTARHGIAHAAWPSVPVDPFFNANAPEDIDEAERLAAAHAEA